MIDQLKKQRSELTLSPTLTSTPTSLVDKAYHVNDVDAKSVVNQPRDNRNTIDILAKAVASHQKSSYTFDVNVKAVAIQQKDVAAIDADAKAAASPQKLKQDPRTIAAVKKTKIFKPDSKHNGKNFFGGAMLLEGSGSIPNLITWLYWKGWLEALLLNNTCCAQRRKKSQLPAGFKPITSQSQGVMCSTPAGTKAYQEKQLILANIATYLNSLLSVFQIFTSNLPTATSP